MIREHKNMRKIHIDEAIWQYKIHNTKESYYGDQEPQIEIRDPENKKTCVTENTLLFETNKNNIIPEQIGFCFGWDFDDKEVVDDSIKHALYQDPADKTCFALCKNAILYDKNKTQEYFGLTPSRIKKYIKTHIIEQ